MTKRRFIEQLPSIHQTPTLRKFFGATVDQVFQPGKAEQISGYVGQRPPYVDPAKDFYLSEKSLERAAYQLEPSMVTTDREGDITRALTYPDLVGYLKSSGGNTDNHQRLFETDFYAWSPPINPDMLLNFRQYYWFGDEDGDADLPVLPLFAPFIASIGDGTRTRFPMPDAFEGDHVETPGALVDQTSVVFERDGDDLVLDVAPAVGSLVLTFRYGTLRTLLEGRQTFDSTLLGVDSFVARHTGDGETTEFALPSVLYASPARERPVLLINGEIADSFPVGPNSIGTTTPPAAGSQVIAIRHGLLRPIIEGRVPPNPMPALSSGMRVLLLDINNQFSGFDTSGYDESPFDLGEDQRGFIEGVGMSMRFVPDSLMVRGLDPLYSVIDRSSIDRNPWSLRNHWVHKDTFRWSGLNFPERQCNRPIVEFIRDIRLWNHGSRRLRRAEAILTTQYATKRLFDVAGNLISTEDVLFEDINGQPFGSIFADDNIPLREDTRLLLAQTNAPQPLLNNRVYRVNVERIGAEDVLVLTPESDVVTAGTIIEVGVATTIPWDRRTWDTSSYETETGYNDRWFDGTSWFPAQTYVLGADPLFALFDGDGVALDDPGRYPGSDFAGSRIFGLAPATGTADSVFGIPVRRDARGQIIYEADISTRRVAWLDGEIEGLYRYILDEPAGSKLGSHWYPAGVTQQEIVGGVYEIPLNLQANPNNEEVDFVSRSEWFDHLSSLIGNQDSIVGLPFTANNYRDTARDLSKGRKVLQHSAPLLKTMLTVSDEMFDIPSAIRFVEQEYTRFRSKFILRAKRLRADGMLRDNAPIDEWVVTVLSALRTEKSTDFAFAFNSVGGGQWFIPSTPASMGLLPCSRPEILNDTTYSSPVRMIKGHDGSLTPASEDWLDGLLLALEQRIYDYIPARFRTEGRPDFDAQRYRASRFIEGSENTYSRAEIQRMLSPGFERWAQLVGLDYRKNDGFDPANAFTWNYRGLNSRDGATLPGNWRAIYRWYYDTDRPHTHPWEMLGFISKPAWWDFEYGVAPYTSGNTKLWEDLSTGRIRQGERIGIDVRYARSGLMDVIPVDAGGDLLDPVAAKIVPTLPTYQQATREWEAGDHGPVENLWITSPSYCFALMEVGFLTKPVRFTEIGWDTVGNGYLNDQWVELTTSQRPQSGALRVHGELDADGVRITKTGVQQWIVDMMISRGQSPALFGDAVRGLGIRLAHKVAGFTTKTGLRAVADNIGIIPNEDISVFLYRSPVIRQEVYSGVVIEWVGNGWRVIGYDARDPYFDVILPDVNGPKGHISLSDLPEPVVNDWRPNTYYSTGSLVSYLGSTYKSLRSHTSSTTFEQSFWDAQESAARSSRVATYLRALDTVERVAYGTVFQRRQDVADFILGYERWLESRGWKFDVNDEENQVVRNWSLCVREFLAWSDIKWAEGAFIALSPGSEELHFSSAEGSILDIERMRGGFFGLIDRSGQPIERRSSRVSRLDGDLTLSAREADIFAARIGIAEIEHLLVFSNLTIFDDVLYRPLYNLRQPRLRLIGNRTADWSGRLDAPGYVLVDGEIVPSFDKAADDIRYAFDIEKADNEDLRDHARHLIGYQSRNYLGNLLLSETQQFEFYQGMIQAKGSSGVFERLLRSQRITESRNLRFLEEWAFRLGRFGARPGPRAAFMLKQIESRSDPQFIRVSGGPTPGALLDWIELTTDDPRWVDKPNTTPLFPMTDAPPALPTAGPVRLSEVQHTVLRTDELDDYYITLANAGKSFTAGDRVWVYNDTPNNTWMVYGVGNVGTTENRVQVILTSVEDDEVVGSRIVFENPHGLTSDDIGSTILIDGETFTTPELRGIHIVSAVDVGGNWIEINDGAEAGYDFTSTDEDAPIVRIFRPVRFATVAERNASPATFVNGDLVYVDDVGNGKWSVFERNGGDWIVYRSQPLRPQPQAISSSIVYDMVTRIDGRRLTANPPLLDRINVIDPVGGIIPGLAERELSYKLDYDPARYGEEDGWGEDHVGKLWWNLDTVRFLEPMTDVLGESTARDLAEFRHRISSWGAIAPGTSVDVYEWIRSEVSPQDYDGDVYGGDSPSWTERREFSPTLDRDVTAYYFWAKNVAQIPKIEGRVYSANTVARMIANPATFDLPWMAPISSDAMLVGGVSTVLNDETSVFKVDIRPEYEGTSHDEWLLLRPEDERSLPPDWLWDRIRDGMVGYNSANQPVPDPTLHPKRRTGIIGGQSVFDPDGIDGVRSGLLEARESYVGIVNTILARTNTVVERPVGVSSLMRETPLDEFLIWSQADGSTYVEPPPEGVAAYTVFDPFERDRVLRLPAVQSELADGNPVRVLLDRRASDLPQWSVWEASPDAYADVVSGLAPGGDLVSALIDAADDIFTLAKAYDRSVATIAQRDLVAPEMVNGERIFVPGVTETNGFWTIWRKDQNATGGFVLDRVQSYRTSDFIEDADWYAEGYSPSRPPVVVYQTISDRNSSSSDASFVRVNNDGTGRWVWTIYENGTWMVVARERGTIALSTSFYDPSRTIHGFGDPSFDGVITRDGSLELRVIFDAIRTGGVLTDLELNEVFFSLIHFIHSQQDEVDWCFKTSLLSVTGYDEVLSQSPVLSVDNTENILAYIEEVKPYRVKTREFLRVLSTEIDEAKIRMTDAHRMTVTIKFDRVAGEPEGEAERAADRILAFYNPTPGMREVSLDTLLGLGFNGTMINGGGMGNVPDPSSELDVLPFDRTGFDLGIEGGDVYDLRIDGTPSEDRDTSINPDVDGRPAYALADPYSNPGHPEERVAISQDDHLSLLIRAKANVGAPPQVQKVFFTENATSEVTFNYGFVALDASAVMVFADGVRLDPSDYVVDHLGQTVTLNPNGAEMVMVHAFGPAGDVVPVTERQFHTHVAGTQYPLETPNANASTAEVIVNGSHITGYTASGGLLSLPGSVPNGADVAINVYESNTGSRFRLRTETLTWNAQQEWTLTNPTSLVWPDHAGCVVEVDGLRLLPPPTFYQYIDTVRWAEMGFVPDVNNITIWVNGIKSTAPVLTGSWATYEDVLNEPAGASLYALWGTKIVSLNPSFRGNIAVVVLENHDYFIEDDALLTIVTPINPASVIKATTIPGTGYRMGVQVANYPGNTDGQYVVQAVPAIDYSWVTVNGRRISPTDYGISQDGMLTIRGGNLPTDRVVVSTYAALPARESIAWMAVTTTTAGARMLPIIDDGGWDTGGWSLGPWDDSEGQQTGLITAVSLSDYDTAGWDNFGWDIPPEREERKLFSMDHSWEYLRVPTVPMFVLESDFGPDATEMVVNTRPVSTMSEKTRGFGIDHPKDGRPGAVWIAGERIEFFGMEVDGDIATITALRRGTRGTPRAGLQLAGTEVMSGTDILPTPPLATHDRHSEPTRLLAMVPYGLN
jgi:hypothetical protein